MTLVDMLKIATGRKLSSRQMQLAEEGKEELHFSGISPESFDGNFDNLWIEGNNIHRRIVRYTLATRRDFSIPNKEHTMYYPVEEDKRIYDKEGLLEERIVERNHPAGWVYSAKSIAYNPPGNWFGKKRKLMHTG